MLTWEIGVHPPSALETQDNMDDPEGEGDNTILGAAKWFMALKHLTDFKNVEFPSQHHHENVTELAL